MRLLKPDQLHVTLAFIGQVGEQKAASALQVVESLPPDLGGEVMLGGLVLFPSSKKARIVGLDITDQREVLSTLYERVVGGLEAAGVMQREKRPFRAHVTIARLKIPGPVQPTSESARARFAIESVCLFRSELRREGAVYTVIARTALAMVESPEKA
jgi:2'-5' RNA ligase